jgi:hypothetical protein
MSDDRAAVRSSPEYGWRFWAFEPARGRLYSPYALQAKLVRELNSAGEIVALCDRNHTPPAPHCYCGAYYFSDWSLLFELEAPPRKRWRWHIDGTARTLRCAVTYGVVAGPIRPDRTGVGSFRGGSFRGRRYTALAVVIPQDLQQVELRPKVPAVFHGITPATCRSVEVDLFQRARYGPVRHISGGQCHRDQPSVGADYPVHQQDPDELPQRVPHSCPSYADSPIRRPGWACSNSPRG